MCGRKLLKLGTTTLNLSLAVNPLKTKHICSVQVLSTCCAVDTFNLGYTKPDWKCGMRQLLLFVLTSVKCTKRPCQY